MKYFFINLKRFEVPRRMGGLSDNDSPRAWIEHIITESLERGLGNIEGVRVVYMVPEAVLGLAAEKLADTKDDRTGAIEVGCQSVHWEDIGDGGNFGALTSSLPAASARVLGASWAMIGHSEERSVKQSIIETFLSLASDPKPDLHAIHMAVDQILAAQSARAAHRELRILFCVGETAEEKGGGDEEEQQERVKAVLQRQLTSVLTNVKKREAGMQELVIGYEPRWASGPGKIPPGPEYIAFVSEWIQEVGFELLERELPVVYGGGLKQSNAAHIASIPSIDGGLVALTRFRGEIGFEVSGLIEIVHEYLSGSEGTK